MMLKKAHEARPIRAPGTSSYPATFAPASEFATLMAAEAHRTR